MTLARPAAAVPLRRQAVRLRREAGLWLFLLPALAFFVLYQLYPILRVLWISFTDYQVLSNQPGRLDLARRTMPMPCRIPCCGRASGVPALFTIMFLPGTIILPLFLALLVDRVTSPRLATFYRVVLLIPAVIPSTLIFVLWKWMYNYQAGPINHFLVETTRPVHPARTHRSGWAGRR